MRAHIVRDRAYVLFVESDHLLRESVGEALYANGFVPLLAADAADAICYMAGASAPVLIILDLDSVEEPAKLLARFRTDSHWSRVPVVVTSTTLELPGVLQVDGILPKPFDAERLVSLGRESIAPACDPPRTGPPPLPQGPDGLSLDHRSQASQERPRLAVAGGVRAIEGGEGAPRARPGQGT